MNNPTNPLIKINIYSIINVQKIKTHIGICYIYRI